MTSPILAIRRRFHPLYYLRKSSLGRTAIRLLDSPVWISIPRVTFKVRGRRITHGLAFAATGSQEPIDELLAIACVQRLGLRSFWDVGANIGFYSWLLKSVAPDLEIVLFEPLPANIAMIRETLRGCSFADVSLVAAGASDRSGETMLRIDALAGATSSIEVNQPTFEERHFGVSSRLEAIRIRSIDDERPNHGPIDLMKIDVEGHEASALRGAQRTITSDQPVLFIECGHPGHPCLDQLERMGYRLIDNELKNGKPANYFAFPERFVSSIPTVLESADQMAGSST